MATAEQLEAALVNADKAASAGDQNAANDARMLAAELRRMRSSSGSVQAPTSAANAAAATMEMPITVESAYSKRYNPQQSTLGYIGNEVGKRVAGLLSVPQMATQAVANNPLMGIPSVIARLGMSAADALGIPTMNKAAENIGIEQNLKAPGPMTQGLTGLGLEIGQNFLFPGTTAQRVMGGIGSFAGGEAGGVVGGKGGEIAGQLIGGVVAPSLVSSRLQAIGDVRNLLKNNSTPDAIQKNLTENPEWMAKTRASVLEELAKTLRENPDQYAARYAQAVELEKKLPGLQLDIGQKFTAPSIIEKEAQLARSSPAMLNRAQAAEQANQGVLQRGLAVGSGSRPTAQSIINRLADDADTVEQAFRRGASDAGERAADIARGANRPADLESIGERALAIRGNEKVAASGVASNLMQQAGQAAEKEAAKFDLEPVVARASQMFKQPIWDDANVTAVINKLDDLGIKAKGGDLTGRSIPPDLMADAGGTANLKELPFADIADLRSAINKDIAAAMRSKSENARTQLRNLQIIKDEVDSVIAASPFEGTKQAYQKFIDYYKGEFAPRFLRGLNLMPEKTRLGGDPALPGERVFAEYFKPGGSTNMARYLRLYENNPEAMQLMKDAILDRYSRKVIDSGSSAINKKAHEQFLKDYAGPLSLLERRGFTFADTLKDSGKAFEEASEASVRIAEKAKQQANDLVLKVIKDKFGAVPADKVADDALADPRKMNLVLGKMSQPEAIAFTQFVRDKIGQGFLADGRVGSAEIGKLLADPMRVQSYEALMTKAFGKDVAARQMENLRAIQDAAKRIELTPVPVASVGTGSPSIFKDGLQKQTGLSYAVIGNMMRAAVTGRVSPEWAATALGSQAGLTIMNNIKNEVYKQVLSDPKTGEELLRLMRAPVESPGFMAATKRLLAKTPAAVKYLIGANQYQNLSGMAAGQIAVRTGQEPQVEGQGR